MIDESTQMQCSTSLSQSKIQMDEVPETNNPLQSQYLAKSNVQQFSKTEQDANLF